MIILTRILLFSLVYHQPSAQNPTSIPTVTAPSATNYNENDSSDSNSYFSEESLEIIPADVSFKTFHLAFPVLQCLNYRIIQFLQVGATFNDRLLQCTPSLSNLGSVAYNRLRTFDLKLDDLSATHAAIFRCTSFTCKSWTAIKLFANFAQIADDLSAVEFALVSGTTPPEPPTTTAGTVTTLPTSSKSTASNGTSSTAIPTSSAVPGTASLNATERACVDQVVINVADVLNGISDCIPNFRLF